MGTRCEIVVVDDKSRVVLFRVTDGYPESMIPFFIGAAKLAMHMARDQKHLLTYAEETAGYLIAYGALDVLYWVRKRGTGHSTNVMPVGRICDLIDYVYVLNVCTGEGGPKWRLDIYEVDVEFWDLRRKGRDRVYARLIKGENGWQRYLKHIDTIEIRVDGNPEDFDADITRILKLIT